MADFTKAEALLQANEWEALAYTAVYESNPLTLTDDIGAVVHICVARKDTNAITAGQEPIVIIWIKSGTGDDDWHELIRFKGSGGTAVAAVLDGTAAAAQNVVPVTSTTGLVHGGVYFLNDNDGIANSELVAIIEVSTDVNVTCLDNLSHEFLTGDDIFNIADQWTVQIPKEVKAARVTIHRIDADATFAVRVRYSKATDIE